MDLDAIEARANAATEGPWKHHPRPNSGPFAYRNEPFPIVYRDHPTAGVGLVILTADRGTEADVAFSAHARTDVPALVARVRELEEESRRIHSAVRRVHAPYDIVPGMPVCRECHPRYDGDDAPYPCPTIRALERARQLSEGGK